MPFFMTWKIFLAKLHRKNTFNNSIVSHANYINCKEVILITLWHKRYIPIVSRNDALKIFAVSKEEPSELTACNLG